MHACPSYRIGRNNVDPMTLINSIITTQYIYIYVVKVKFLPTVVLIVQYQSQSGGKISNFLQYIMYIIMLVVGSKSEPLLFTFKVRKMKMTQRK